MDFRGSRIQTKTVHLNYLDWTDTGAAFKKTMSRL